MPWGMGVGRDELDPPLGRFRADPAALIPGQHLCSFHAGQQEYQRVAAATVLGGLAAGDRVLVITSGPPPTGILGLPAGIGLGVGGLVRSGQLVVRRTGEVYENPAVMELERMAAALRAAVGQARLAGFPGLRVTAEMGDFARTMGPPERLARWERMVSRLFQEIGAAGVCHYAQGSVTASTVALLAEEHSAVAALAPSVGAMPPALFLAATDPGTLRLAGELDLATHAALGRTLRARLAVSPALRLDLSGLSFIDVGSVELIHHIAARLPGTGRITLAAIPAPVRRLLDLIDIHSERVRVEP